MMILDTLKNFVRKPADAVESLLAGVEAEKAKRAEDAAGDYAFFCEEAASGVTPSDTWRLTNHMERLGKTPADFERDVASVVKLRKAIDHLGENWVERLRAATAAEEAATAAVKEAMAGVPAARAKLAEARQARSAIWNNAQARRQVIDENFDLLSQTPEGKSVMAEPRQPL